MSARRMMYIGLALLFASCSRTTPVATTQPTGPSPNPAMSPDEVVKTIVLAMQHNDIPSPDAGIATAFRFASPNNRRFTGPLEHFASMVKEPMYASLLNFKSVEFQNLGIRGAEARFIIKIHTQEDDTRLFGWSLSKQDEGQFAKCWMTDSVVPLQEGQDTPQQPPPAPPQDDSAKAKPV